MKHITALTVVVLCGCAPQRPSNAGKPTELNVNPGEKRQSLSLQKADGINLYNVSAVARDDLGDGCRVEVDATDAKLHHSLLFGGSGELTALIVRENGKVKRTAEFRPDGTIKKVTVYAPAAPGGQVLSFTVFTYGESGELLGKQSGSSHDG